MKGFGFLTNVIKTHYDKLVAFLVLVCLLLSLLYLAVQIGSIQGMQKEFDRKIDMNPRHPKAEQVHVSRYKSAQASIRHPFQITNVGSNRSVFLPEERVWCIDCRLPIPLEADICPFCKTKQPPPDDKNIEIDSDSDGIPDIWEKRLGLDAYSGKDARQDKDGDGFLNIEEFGRDPKTGPVSDLNDPKSYPPIVAKLYVDRIEAHPFKLRFKSVSKLPGGGLRFALNLQTGRFPKTYFKKMKEEVHGFELFKYTHKTRMEKIPGWPKPRPRDISELVLKRGEKLITLIKDTDVQHDEYTIKFYFALDGSVITSKIGDIFELKEEKYKVIRIDSSRQSVVIQDVKDGKQSDVRRRSSE